jgi:hypothetical protein
LGLLAKTVQLSTAALGEQIAPWSQRATFVSARTLRTHATNGSRSPTPDVRPTSVTFVPYSPTRAMLNGEVLRHNLVLQSLCGFDRRVCGWR